MAVNALYIKNLTADPRNMIFIQGTGTTEPIFGFIDSSQTFGASASWNGEMVGSSITEAMTKGSEYASKAVGMSGVFKPFALTSAVWQSSSLNALSLSVFIVATESGENPLSEANKIWDYVLPGSDFGMQVQVAPGGYSVNVAGTQTGAITLNIGKWFRAVERFVVSSAQIEVSKEMISGTDKPLYVKIDVILNPARDFSAQEVKEWFIGA